MNQRIKSILQDKKTLGLYLIFLLAILYFCVGLFHVAPVEGDGIGIAMGAQTLSITGDINNNYMHLYNVQSGTYQILSFFYSIFKIDTFVIFSYLSLVAGILFILFSSLLLKKILQTNIYTCLLVILLFQESVSSIYYPNSTILAAPFMAISFYFLFKSKKNLINTLITGLIFSIGIWIRYDLILIAPVALFLIYDRNIKLTLFYSIVFAIISFGFSTIFILLSNANLFSIFNITSTLMNTEVTGSDNIGIIGLYDIKSLISFFSVLIIFLCFLGIYYMIKKRSWIHLLIFIIPVIIVFYFQTGKLTTPKYIYYLIPFVSIPIIYFFKELMCLNKKIKSIFIIIITFLFLFQYIIGFRLSFSNKLYVEESYSVMQSTPTLATLFSKELNRGIISNCSFVIGSGSVVNTDDANRLSSGIFFYPLMWYNLKEKINTQDDLCNNYLKEVFNNSDTTNIFVTQYHAVQFAKYILIRNGFSIQSTNYDTLTQKNKIIFLKNDKTCILNSRKFKDRTFENLYQNAKDFNCKTIYYLSTYPWEQNILTNNIKLNINKQIAPFLYKLTF